MSPIAVELTALAVAVIIGAFGWLIVRGINQILTRLDRLEARQADHELKTATIETKVDLLMADHRRMLGDHDDTETR